MKLSKREEAELKVVEYAKSVNWDFDKVFKKVDEGDSLITWDEYLLLDIGEEDRIKNILDKYKPKEEEFKWGDRIEYYFNGNWHNGIYIAKGFNIRGHVVHKLPSADMSPILIHTLRKVKIELTRQQIAEKFNIPVEQLVIKD